MSGEPVPPSSPEIVSQLQETLLKAILLNRSLPGSDQLPGFPDLALIRSQPTIYLIDENLAGPLSLGELPQPVRILPLEALRQETRDGGNLFALRFRQPEAKGDTLGMTLDMVAVPPTPAEPPRAVSGLHVTFQKVGEEWRAIDQPIAYAS